MGAKALLPVIGSAPYGRHKNRAVLDSDADNQAMARGKGIARVGASPRTRRSRITQIAHTRSLTPARMAAWHDDLRSFGEEGRVVAHVGDAAGVIADGRPSPVVAVDFDATVFPLFDALRALPHVPPMPLEEITYWDYLLDQLGGVEGLVSSLNMVARFDHASQFAPFEGATRGLAHLVEHHNVRLVVMTDRPPETAPDTLAYLEHHGVPTAGVLCGKLPDKVTPCGKLGADVLIDDRPSTIEAAHAAGMSIHTLAWPYNERERAALGIPGARDWDELTATLDRQFAGSAAADVPLAHLGA